MRSIGLALLISLNVLAQETPPEPHPIVKAMVEAETEEQVIEELQKDPNVLVKPRTPRTDDRDLEKHGEAYALERSFGFLFGSSLQDIRAEDGMSYAATHHFYGGSLRIPYKYVGRVQLQVLREHHPLDANSAAYETTNVDPLSATTYLAEYDIWIRKGQKEHQDWFTDFGLSLGYYQKKIKMLERPDYDDESTHRTFYDRERGIQLRIRNLPWKDVYSNLKSSGGIYFFTRVSTHGKVSVGIGGNTNWGPKVWIPRKVSK